MRNKNQLAAHLRQECCPRCRLILARDLCVCGWQRPRRLKKKPQRDWYLKAGAVLAVFGALWVLINGLIVEP